MHEHDPLGLQFTHDPFVAKTVPIDHVLCDDLTYTSTFITDTGTVAITDLEPFKDVMNDAIGYDPTTLTHSV